MEKLLWVDELCFIVDNIAVVDKSVITMKCGTHYWIDGSNIGAHLARIVANIAAFPRGGVFRLILRERTDDWAVQYRTYNGFWVTIMNESNRSQVIPENLINFKAIEKLNLLYEKPLSIWLLSAAGSCFKVQTLHIRDINDLCQKGFVAFCEDVGHIINCF